MQPKDKIDKLDKLNYIKKFCVHNDFPQKGVKFIDVFPLMQRFYPFDINRAEIPVESIVFLPESRGFLFYQWCKKYSQVVPCRKRNKLPGELVSISYKKEYGEDQLFYQIDSLKSAIRSIAFDNNIVSITLFDDVLATGGTMLGLIDALHGTSIEVDGENFILKVKSVSTYIELTNLKGREAINERGIEVYSVYQIDGNEL